MTQANLVSQYFSAWNDRDVDAVLDLMHRGAAIYDAFWLEACVGKHLRQYLCDRFEDEPYFYRLIGEVIITETGVAYRYSAHDARPAGNENLIYEGARALTLRDGLILTMSDFYCSPKVEDLTEVAQLAARRHGLTRHVDFGISASRYMRLRTQLADFVANNPVEHNAAMTIAEVANKIDCRPFQLLKVIDAQYGTSFAASEAKPTSIRLGHFLPST